MDLPALTRRGFWTRVVLFSVTLVAYVSIAILMAREHSLAGVVLFVLLALFSLTGLAATFWRRSSRRSS
jgi:tryptophan-rich sensory protein